MTKEFKFQLLGETLPNLPIEEWLHTEMGLPTGIHVLDDCIRGFQPQDYVIIAGSTSVGKSALATSIMLNCKPDEPVFMSTMEMCSNEVAHRLLANMTKLNWHNVLTQPIPESHRQMIQRARQELETRCIVVDDRSGLTPSLLRSHLDKMIDQFGSIKYVIIDYVQLMSGDTNENRQQEMSNVSRELRRISRDYNTVLVAVAQLNRNPAYRIEEGNRPRLNDLRESGSFEQDATKVLLLHRPGYWERERNQDTLPLQYAQPEETEIQVAKNRNGPTKTVYCNWRPEYMMFDDKPEAF